MERESSSTPTYVVHSSVILRWFDEDLPYASDAIRLRDTLVYPGKIYLISLSRLQADVIDTLIQINTRADVFLASAEYLEFISALEATIYWLASKQVAGKPIMALRTQYHGTEIPERIARGFGISQVDALYVLLAILNQLPLLVADRQLFERIQEYQENYPGFEVAWIQDLM